MAAIKTQLTKPAKGQKSKVTKATKAQKSKPTAPVKAKTSRISKGRSGLKLYIHKDRISTTPMTANPKRVCLRENYDCEKHVQEWTPRTAELVARIEAWLEQVHQEGQVAEGGQYFEKGKEEVRSRL